MINKKIPKKIRDKRKKTKPKLSLFLFRPREGCELQPVKLSVFVSGSCFRPREGCELQRYKLENGEFVEGVSVPVRGVSCNKA